MNQQLTQPRNDAAAARQAERGMTLVELMVVIAILGLMAGAVTLAVVPQLRKSKADITLQEMSAIYSACEMFEIEYNRMPEDLDELKNPPDDEASLIKTGDFKDAWGNDYELAFGDQGLILRSLGSDGLEGGSGDARDLEWPQEDDD